MNRHTVIFCGTSEFAIPSLEALLGDPVFNVLLVITQPDRPIGRLKKIMPPPLKPVAEHANIPILQPNKLRHELLTLAGVPRPDYLVVVSYGQLLSEDILAYPTIAPINVHASLLPRWRGASPIHHAILQGDKETGVTIQKMEPQLDAGPILAQARTTISLRETYQTLHDRLAEIGASLLVKTMKEPLLPRTQEGEVTHCRKLTRDDGLVDPQTMTAEEIDRRVRALFPWPGVLIHINSQPLKILETYLEAVPGSTLLSAKDGTILHLARVQQPGRDAVTGVEWQRATTSSSSPATHR